MRFKPIVLIVLAATAVGMSAPLRNADPPDLIRRAIDAVGGEQALRGLHTLVLENGSAGRNAGQEQSPGGMPNVNMNTARLTIDRVGRRLRTDAEIRGPGVPNNGLARVSNVATPDAGMNINLQGRFNPMARAGHQNGLNNIDGFMPMLLLSLQSRPESVAAVAPRMVAGEQADGIRFLQNGNQTTLYFSRRTGLPLMQEVLTDHNVLGDLMTTTSWGNWSTTAVRLPQFTTIESSVSLTVQWQRLVSMNEPVADSLFSIPDSVVTRFRAQPPAPAAGSAPPLTVTQLEPGVWRAAAAGYNSLIVEQPDRLVLVEAPLSPVYVRSLLDTLAARFPGKRVGTVVNTHHHWDHAGGIRAVLAAGIPVVTHERNVEFVRGVGTARRTVRPDALSQRGRLPAITAVTDSLVIGSGDRRVVVYTAETTQDGGQHLVAFVPAAGLLFQSDMLAGPPNGVGQIQKPAATDITTIVRQRNLAVSKVLGGHGDVAAMEAVTRAAQ